MGKRSEWYSKTRTGFGRYWVYSGCAPLLRDHMRGGGGRMRTTAKGERKREGERGEREEEEERRGSDRREDTYAV